MSACLFTVGDKYFDQNSVESIKKDKEYIMSVMDEFEKTPEQHDNRFYTDRYSGFSSSLDKINYFLIGYERALKGKE